MPGSPTGRLTGEPWTAGVGCRRRRLSKTSHYNWWKPVKLAFGKSEMDFNDLRHFCATHLLQLGVSHADVAVQLGHTLTERW